MIFNPAEARSDRAGVSLAEVVSALDEELQTALIVDYGGAMNGLQLANSGRVSRVAVAVDASRQAIERAAEEGADLLIVHHGLFWSGAQPITGMAYERYRRLFAHDIAVYSSHLPLDLHATLGNNVRLAQELSLSVSGGFARYKSLDIGVQGECDEDTEAVVERVRKFSARYGGSVRTSVPTDLRRSRRWAICSGGGASTETIREAVAAGIDTLIVGEGPHHATVDAIEHDLCIIFAGHYATETLGVQALGAWLESRFALPWSFLHLPTGS